eukprot:scaffold20225_cov121-Isochrysis_galbana.AAC.3
MDRVPPWVARKVGWKIRYMQDVQINATLLLLLSTVHAHDTRHSSRCRCVYVYDVCMHAQRAGRPGR